MKPEDAAAALSGAWRLCSYVDRAHEDAPWEATFGDEPRGAIVYFPSGLLSVNVSTAANVSPSLYVSYIGTYRIRDAREIEDGSIEGVVDHLMEAAAPPELLEEGPERPFRLRGDELLIGDGRLARRHFERER